MQANIDLLEDQARALRAEGQWTFADHLESAIAEIKDTRAVKVSGNDTREAASLVRKYDWISKQDGGIISAADVARDIRESFGIKIEGKGSADEHDDRQSPYYEMNVEEITVWRDAVMRVMRAAWTLVDNTEGDANVDRQDWTELSDALIALGETIPEVEHPAEPPYAVTLLWTDRARRLRLCKDQLIWERTERLRLNKTIVSLSSDAIKDIATERQRQIDEGWAPEDDDTHGNEELAAAASCYALPTRLRGDILYARSGDTYRTSIRDLVWPWTRAHWNPKDRRCDLVRAGALIVAEIERLDRASTPNDEAKDEPRHSPSTRYDE